MRRVLSLTLLLALLAVPALADEIVSTYHFTTPTLAVRAEGAVEPAIAGLPQSLVPGEPVVPVQTAWLALPQNHEVVSVSLDTPKSGALADGLAAWGPHFLPYSAPDEGPAARPNPAIYQGYEPFPAQSFEALSVQYKRGAAILPVKLYPVRYLPAARRFVFTPEMTVRVVTRPRLQPLPGVLPFRGLPADLRELRQRVDNPAVLAGYRATAAPKGDPVDYLVIAPAKFFDALTDLLTHKTELFGLRCELVDYDTVLTTMTGATKQARVRNYLIQRYADGVQWVLLVGDADLGSEEINLQPLYVTGTDPDDGSTYTDESMASDLYYGCLDGSYNEDGDSYFGETNDGPGGGDVDLLYDVHVGRFAVDELWEARIMASKTVAFENDFEMPWNLLFVGEYADESTQGGDLKDKVYEYCGDQTIPLTTRYDRDGTLNFNSLLASMNGDQVQWLNHIGHANVTYNMLFDPSTVTELTNTRYFLGFSQGCYSGSVDGLDVDGYLNYVDSMAEQFTAKQQHGAFAYFMNTRYGFYLRGRVDGPSNVYDWELADAFFNEGIPNIGAAMDKAKEDCIGLLSPTNMMRWAWYTLMLFGDPQTPMRLNCDNDGDGFVSAYCQDGNDCQDTDAAVNPDAAEICDDGVDNNCDGLTDGEDPACAPTDDDTAADDDDDNTDDDAGDDDAADDDDDNADDDASDDDATDDDDDAGGSGDDDSGDDDDGGCG